MPGCMWSSPTTARARRPVCESFTTGVSKPRRWKTTASSGTIRTSVPFKIGQRSGGDPLSAAGISDLRIYKRTLDPGEVQTLARSARLSSIAGKPPIKRTAQETDLLFGWWIVTLDRPFQALTTELGKLEREQSDIKARGQIVYVMEERKQPATAYILFRGEYDKRRDQVSAETPASLPPFPKNAPRNRLGLARWLLSPENPLAARVAVNRFWQEVFGTGIVRTSGDFGVAGELPSHPELLDWLAVEFRESGWDVKKLFKLMVTSATYRQSAQASTGRSKRTRRISFSRADRGFAWMPRWFAIRHWPSADFWWRSSAGPASNRISRPGFGRRSPWT